MPRIENGKSALLIVDVINDLEFPGGEKVLPWAHKMTERLLDVMNRARSLKVPVIYVNDNFGLWQSNFNSVIEHCTREGARGRDFVKRLSPTPADFFILKPKHSAFYSTSLVPLLDFLNVKQLVLAGIATNLCVMYTANDAHMHELDITVLSDCCAAESDADHDWALDQLKRFVHVRVCRSDELELPDQSGVK